MKFKTKFAALLSMTIMLATPAFSQYATSSYFMKDNWQSNMLNPALTPEHGYVLIPVIGGTGINFNSNNLSVDDLFYANPNGEGLVPFFDVDIDKTDLLNSLKEENNFNVDFSTPIFGVGFHSNDKKLFWNFGVNLKAHGDISIPKGAFEFAALSREDKMYNFQNLGVALTGYAEAYAGVSAYVSDKLSVGGRVKFLMGLCNADINYNKFNVAMTDSEWRVSSSGMLNATAIGLSLQGDEFEFDNLNFKPSLDIVGYGAGIDLGANYNLLDNLSVSLSITDLGFISWSKDKTISANSTNDYIYSGVGTDSNNIEDLNIDEILSFESVESESRTTSLNSNIYAAAEYRFLDDLMAVGVLYNTDMRKYYVKHEVTTVASVRPLDFLTANLSYSFVANQIGAAINIHPSWINIFVGADYIPKKVTPQYVPIGSKNFNIYAGISIPLTRRE